MKYIIKTITILLIVSSHLGASLSAIASSGSGSGSEFSSSPSGEFSLPRAKNILLICVDDLRPELKSFGADYIHSPNIDRLAADGRAFHRHYVNAPSCGPSRYTMLTGRYGPYSNHALFQRAEEMKTTPGAISPSMPEWFRQHGYTTVSVGKVSHNPGGLGGQNWDDPNVIEMPDAWDRHLMPVGEWQHPRGAMHGLANGEIRVKQSEMDVFQTVAGPDTIYPDGLIAEEGLKQLDQLAAQEKPFFLAIGLIKPHLPFGAPKKYMDLYDGVELPPILHYAKPEGRTTWHGSGEFMAYNHWGIDPRKDVDFATEVRRHYAACVSYADKQVGDIIAKLKETGADQDTIVVLWGDHGWSLGEQALWGKHSLFEEALHSPLIVYYPGIEKPGVTTDAVVETLDLFPTLCDLIGISTPDFVEGVTMVPLLDTPDASGHSAIAYVNGAQTIRTATHRLTVHSDGFVELYDHTSPEVETLNVAADYPALVNELTQALQERIALKNGEGPNAKLPANSKVAVRTGADIQSQDTVLLIEAEDATMVTGVIQGNRSAASAGKFVNFNPATPAQFIEWEVTLPSAGTYGLSLGYANADRSMRVLKLFVNGKQIEDALAFPSSKGWNNWIALNVDGVSLNAGLNIIRVETLVNADGPNVDYLRITD
ncbi:sulfatase-like hydrolase/transferase [Coraliomargarita sp. W4R53]